MPEQQLIDLTMTLRAGLPGYLRQPRHLLEKDGWNSSSLDLYSHAGTHMDAPKHFGAGPRTIDQTPLSRCLSTAWVADLRAITKPGCLITLEDIGDITGKIQAGQSLLLHTGWSSHIGDPAFYRDQLPRISEQIANWCVENRLNLIGVEAPSVADVNDLQEVTRIHKILLGADILIVEGLTGLDALPRGPFTFGAFPLKIEGGDGCPCRAFAILES
jgi:kynurenine formamidase